MTIEDKTVPEFVPDIIATELSSVAIDLGLEKLYIDNLNNQGKSTYCAFGLSRQHRSNLTIG